MAVIEAQDILKKGTDGIFYSLRGNYVKDANGIFQQFKPGDGIKGVDGNWYILKSSGPSEIELIGLVWDTENLADYKTWDEGMALAAGAGKRLPTQAEWVALAALPNEWDDTLKGRWFAATADDLATKDKTKCLFFPAVGMADTNGSLYNQGTWAYYWSSSPVTTYWTYYLDISASGVNPSTYANKYYGYSLRCVRNIN